MQLVEVYVVRTEAPEACFATGDHVLAREADVVGAFAHREMEQVQTRCFSGPSPVR